MSPHFLSWYRDVVIIIQIKMKEDLDDIDIYFRFQSQSDNFIFDTVQQEKDLCQKISNFETPPKHQSDEYFGKQEPKKRSKKDYARKKDHNRMKKIHSLIFKALKKTIGLKKMNELGYFRHRHDYLIIALTIATHFDALEMFCQIFTEKLLLCLQANLESELELNNSDYCSNQCEELGNKNKVHLTEAIQQVMKAIKSYQIGNLNQCIEALYDKDNIKNKQYFEQAKRDAQEFMKLSERLKCEESRVGRSKKEKFAILMAKYKPKKRCQKKK